MNLAKLTAEALYSPIYASFFYFFFSCPMGLDLTIVIFLLLKCGLYGNMPLNIPGINAKLKQTKYLSTCQEDSCFSLTILRTKHFRDWAAEMKERRGCLKFLPGKLGKFPWNFLALRVLFKSSVLTNEHVLAGHSVS